MKFTYSTTGTCARAINFNIEGNKIISVGFEGGCGGNTQGVAALLAGMTVDDAIARLRGIRCGSKPTSCPDQLARALEQMKAENEQG